MLIYMHLGQLFQQMCGTSITVAYATSIFEQRLGFGAVKSRGLAISLSSLLIFGGAATVRKFPLSPKTLSRTPIDDTLIAQ